MKLFKYITLLLLISLLMMMQACGGEGGSTDTSGSLTISTPAANDNGNGTSSVTFTVTYSPPSGKTAQGVVVSTTINGYSTSYTLTSGSNSVSYSPIVNNGTYLNISASVNAMTSSTVFYVKTVATGTTGTALAVTPALADFLFTDAAGSIKTIVISGGTAPYLVKSSVPADISAIMATSTNVSVTLINAAVSASPGITSSATVTVTDSATPAAIINIPVTYKK